MNNIFSNFLPIGYAVNLYASILYSETLKLWILACYLKLANLAEY